MTRYFFHIRNGKILDDHVGREFACWHDVRNEAFRRATVILKENLDYQEGPPWQMRVVDEDGQAVLTIGFQAKRTKAEVPA